MTTTAHGHGAPVTRVSPPPPLSQTETIEDLLVQSKRGTVPIRKTFVQKGWGKTTEPGPLNLFVRAHDDRALDAYLLVHALASAEPWNCDYPSGTWIRALGASQTATPSSARGAVSKTFRRIEQRGLIKRSRVGRVSSLVLLREDGSGKSYERPTSKDRADWWLHLPYAYWFDGHFLTLSLPAKAMLLVALSRPDGFHLPADRVEGWYGISPSTADRGLRELRSADLLSVDRDWIKEQRSETGWVERLTYTLEGPYSSEARVRAAKTRLGDEEEDA